MSWTQPEGNDVDSVDLALKALREAHDEVSAVDATDRFLWSVGDNDAGTFYPVVLSTLAPLGEILDGVVAWARRATIEALIDLGGTFVPETGHETHLGASVRDAVRAFILSCRPRIVALAGGSEADAGSAAELLELIDDLSP
jgi:hypothetical protein